MKISWTKILIRAVAMAVAFAIARYISWPWELQVALSALIVSVAFDFTAYQPDRRGFIDSGARDRLQRMARHHPGMMPGHVAGLDARPRISSRHPLVEPGLPTGWAHARRIRDTDLLLAIHENILHIGKLLERIGADSKPQS